MRGDAEGVAHGTTIRIVAVIRHLIVSRAAQRADLAIEAAGPAASTRSHASSDECELVQHAANEDPPTAQRGAATVTG